MATPILPPPTKHHVFHWNSAPVPERQRCRRVAGRKGGGEAPETGVRSGESQGFPAESPKREIRDTKLLALLKANAREPTASLARKLGLARSTVQERIARLEREGAIKGYTVRLSEEAETRSLRAVVMITADPKQADRVSAELKRMAEVRSLSAVSGALRHDGDRRSRHDGAHGRRPRPHRQGARRGAHRVVDHIVGEVYALSFYHRRWRGICRRPSGNPIFICKRNRKFRRAGRCGALSSGSGGPIANTWKC